jgi:hypothetical protein
MISELNIVVVEANYDWYPEIVDVDLFSLSESPNALVICPREGTKVRLEKSRKEGLHSATIVGWWDMIGKPMKSLENFDTIFVIDPSRISDPVAQEQWNRIIEWNQ